MSRLTRLVVALVAMMTALVSTAAPAQAVGNAEAAAKAAGYLASQRQAASADVGSAIDSLLALAAVGDDAQAEDAKALLDAVDKGAAAYAKTPEGAAKLALVAEAYGLDPTDVNGVDAIAALKAGIKDNGAFGQYPGPFASGMAMIALQRSGNDVPASMVTYLTGLANSDGGFTFEKGKPSDADNTGMALLGLSAAENAPGASQAIDRAQKWAASAQAADGSWAGYNKINSTAIMAMALENAGQPQQKAVDFLAGHQLADGAMPGDGNKPNLLATQQAALALAEASYADVEAPASYRPAGAATPSATPTPTATDAQNQSGVFSWLPWALLVLVVIAVVAFLMGRRRSSARAAAGERTEANAAPSTGATRSEQASDEGDARRGDSE
ncbi:prenyltransferase/squalene oxidase repeat-containing protein [Nigerium massiliense]|uniref:prenyltransferase/squalene oxidase repeat-containing protein n=1 Tax=Nigerium massiliense TaxID=1522317 RepID=UPI00058B9848|nr:prenyltransferase/squalene oxidase repeat-containing protein [Nigerium massiliense]